MKKTSVEWLVSQLNKKGFAQVVTDEEIEQALAMEKEQMMQFCSIYANLILQGHPITPSEFYNQTFYQKNHERANISTMVD